MTKSLADITKINYRYQRSARIDNDNSIENIKSFIVHETAKSTLKRILEDNGNQNTFTITGPYGGGKSSLALFLSALFDSNKKVKDFAKSQLSEFLDLKKASIINTSNTMVIKIVGQKNNPIEDLKKALQLATKNFNWKKGAPKILKPNTDKSLIESINNIFESLKSQGGSLVLIMDEMGKYLEYCSDETQDLQLFQELAENFTRSQCSSLLVGILHQSFGDYSRKLDDQIRNNWMKVQGRYFDIPYSVAIDEVIYLLAEAISGRKTSTVEKKLCREVGTELKDARLGSSKNLSNQLTSILPLHPLCSILLGPFTRKRFGQNERSLFGFLTSNEPHSFNYFLKNENQTSSKLYSPDLFYDYLKINLEPSILSSPDGHFWSEAVEAIARVERQGSEHHIQIIKTISLIDFLGKPFDIRASENLLQRSFPNLNITPILKDLAAWSSIVYRKHKKAWSLFSGSDLDLNLEIEKNIDEIGDNYLTIAQSIPTISPIVAKKHYFTTGSLRWFNIKFTDIKSLNKSLDSQKKDQGIGTFYIVLYDHQESISTEVEIWHPLLKNTNSKGIICLSVPKNNKAIKSLALEIAALERIKAHEPALQNDPVARRELSARMYILIEQLDNEAQTILNNSDWICINNKMEYKNIPSSQLASSLADEFYYLSPEVKNEFVNKDKISAVAVSASKNLLRSMIDNEEKENLGFQGYPPELAIYKSVLQKNNIHSKIGATFKINDYKEFKDLGLKKMSQDFYELLDQNSDRKVNLTEILEKWSEPPYGIKLGLVPILAVAFYLARNDKIALFVDEIFTPDFDEYAINRLYNNINVLSFRSIELGNINKNIMTQIADITQSDIKQLDTKSVLAIVKPLVKFAFDLPSYMKRTERLTDITKKVRSTLLNAKDPVELLRKDLPIALGLEYDSKLKTIKSNDINNYPVLLKESFDELNKKKTSFDMELKKVVESALELTERDLDKDQISSEAKYLLGKSGDYKLELFINVLSNLDKHENWIHRLAELAADKPINNWYDIDYDRAIYELNDLVSRYKRVKKHFVREHSEKGSYYISIIASEQNKPILEFEEPFKIDESDSSETKNLYEKMNKILDEHKGSEEIKLKALIEIFESLKKNKEFKKDKKIN